MDRRTLGNALAVIAILCFVAAIIGMAISGSHRWVEPAEEAGWIFFVGCVLVLYLMVDPDSVEAENLNPKWANAAWAFGGLSIALLIAAFIANVVSLTYRYWFESIETAGLVAMVITILCAVMARGTLGRSKE